MKRLIYLCIFCILLTIFNSCKKSDNYNKTIVGNWELKQTFASNGTHSYAKGNGNILKFTNSNYEIYRMGSLTKTGDYILVPDTTVQFSVCLILPSSQYKNRIVFDGKEDTRKTFVKTSENELAVVSGCFANDSGELSTYERQ